MVRKNYTTSPNIEVSLGWIFFIILLSTWLVFGMSDIVGIVGGILGILAFAWQFIRWILTRLKYRRPFKITFSKETREKIHKDSDMATSIQLPIGETRILLRVKTQLSANLTETFIRPVNKKWNDVVKEGDEPLRIEKAEQTDDKFPKYDVFPDNVGGVKLYYSELYERPQRVNVHYYLTVKAIKKWSGRLMFSATINDKREYSYGDIEII
jgi:hypothetical protein